MSSGMAPASTAVSQALSPDTQIQDAISQARDERQSLRDMILGQGADDAEKSKMNLSNSLMKAGFAMMGGRSPFAGVNIGEGAMAGLDSYQKGIEQLDAAKQGRIKQLVDMGLKGQDLDNALQQMGITKDYYDAHKKLFDAQADLARSGAVENLMQAKMMPIRAQIAAARAAGAGGTKSSMNLSEWKYKDELKDKYLNDPRLGADLPGRNASPGSPSYNAYQAEVNRRAEALANRELNTFLQQKGKQARTGDFDYFPE
jgi:hypothetical protein